MFQPSWKNKNGGHTKRCDVILPFSRVRIDRDKEKKNNLGINSDNSAFKKLTRKAIMNLNFTPFHL